MRMEINKEENRIAELMAAFYINIFILLRPISVVYSYRWSFILGGLVVIMLLSTVKSTSFKINGRTLKELFLLVICVSLIFLFDLLFRRNLYTVENYTGFILYGAVTGLFISNIRDFKALLKYWGILASVGGVIYIFDPFQQYLISGGYMNFGSAVLPAFAACVVGFNYYKKKIILPLAAVFFLEIAIYANKGALVSAVAIVIFFTIFNTENKSARRKRLCLFIVLAGCVFFFLPNILAGLVRLANILGVASYSLTDLDEILTRNNRLSSYTVRTGIWDNVIHELKANPLFGMGIGGFESKYGNYAHNFFLDILITHGIIVGTIVFGALIKMIKNSLSFIHFNKDLFVFSFIMLLLWIFPSFFSFTYWKLNAFWIFVIINMFYKKRDLAREV